MWSKRSSRRGDGRGLGFHTDGDVEGEEEEEVSKIDMHSYFFVQTIASFHCSSPFPCAVSIAVCSLWVWGQVMRLWVGVGGVPVSMGAGVKVVETRVVRGVVVRVALVAVGVAVSVAPIRGVSGLMHFCHMW